MFFIVPKVLMLVEQEEGIQSNPVVFSCVECFVWEILIIFHFLASTFLE